MLGILVPEMECPVATRGTEGAVLRVEGYRIDGVDVRILAAGWGGAMAFEREIRAAVLVLDVLDGTASLHAPNSEPASVVEACDHSCLPFQR